MPEDRLTSRSAERPPSRTATLLVCGHGTPTRLISHSSVDAGFRLHPGADLFAQRFDVGGGGVAGVDQEVAVLLGDLGGAVHQAAAAGFVDQLPGLVAGRILEGRAAGLAT